MRIWAIGLRTLFAQKRKGDKMYSKFQLSVSLKDVPNYEEQGKNFFESYHHGIQRELKQFINEDGIVDGSKLQENWFATGYEFDVFLSHSHKDKALAIKLACFLHEKLGLKTFIDSCIWGCSDELLLTIDNKYCKNPSGDTYSYEKRNCSTSYVHMMLSIALMTMMDRCEAIFFLNTPNSICLDVAGGMQETSSPWIYNELSLANIIQKRSNRVKKVTALFEEGFMYFDVDKELRTFHKLTMNDLVKCEKNKGPLDALEYIYQLVLQRSNKVGMKW